MIEKKLCERFWVFDIAGLKIVLDREDGLHSSLNVICVWSGWSGFGHILSKNFLQILKQNHLGLEALNAQVYLHRLSQER